MRHSFPVLFDKYRIAIQVSDAYLTYYTSYLGRVATPIKTPLSEHLSYTTSNPYI